MIDLVFEGSSDRRVTSRRDYTAFGEESVTPERVAGLGYAGQSETRNGYTGYEKDTESGLDFAQARYYNSVHGRFTSVDPLTASATIRNPQTFNRYTYVLNSPYKFTDPLGLIPETTGACGNRCRNSDGGGGGFVGLYSDNGSTIVIADEQQAESPTPPPAPANYYISRNGTITVEGTSNSYSSYYIEDSNSPTGFRWLANREHNEAGLVYFPDELDFFSRYSTKDAGGKNNGVDHGKGDHYINPLVAAALFGLAAVLKDTHGIHMSFGDMSADNGSDPWQKGFKDHKGHGHSGRSGLDVDIRYIGKDGKAFHGTMNSNNFDHAKNETVFKVAQTFGFTENYRGSVSLSGARYEAGHDDHGHLGFSLNPTNVVYR